MATLQLDLILEFIRNWTESRSDIRGVALVGSWARGNPKPDSDIDLIILTTDPNSYCTDTAWLRNMRWSDLGLTMTRSVTAEYGEVRSLHLYFAEANKIEFGFTLPTWARVNPMDAGTRKVVRDGMRIILDRDALFARLLLELTTK